MVNKLSHYTVTKSDNTQHMCVHATGKVETYLLHWPGNHLGRVSQPFPSHTGQPWDVLWSDA